MRRVLIRLFSHPYVLLPLLVVALLAGLSWYQSRPPSRRSILVGAATLLPPGRPGAGLDRSRLCAEGCYERYAIEIEAIGSRQITEIGRLAYVDVDVSYQPPLPAGAARRRQTVRFWHADQMRVWSVGPAGPIPCGHLILISENPTAPSRVSAAPLGC